MQCGASHSSEDESEKLTNCRLSLSFALTLVKKLCQPLHVNCFGCLN